MGDLEIHVIAGNAQELAALAAERKSYRLFFTVFGGIFALAAAISLWPYDAVTRTQWSVCAVCLLFLAGFFLLYRRQLKDVNRNLRDPHSVMYSGVVTRKEQAADGDAASYRIFIADRPFDVAAPVYEDIRIGDFLAVREWRATGEYIEHTTDRRHAQALRERATRA